MLARPTITTAAEPFVSSSMEISLSRLRANVRRVSDAAKPRRLIAVVKGDAYGHGAVQVGQEIARGPVRELATGSLEDAIALRNAGVRLPIVMLGDLPPEVMSIVVGHRLTPSVSNRQCVLAAAAASGRARTPIHVKVDAGFGRFGVPLASAHEFIAWVSTLPRLRLAGVYTHVPFSDAEGREWAAARLRDFAGLLDTLSASAIEIPTTQAISSAGMEAGLLDRCNTVACGSLLYGFRATEFAVPSRLQTKSATTAIRTRLAGVTSGLARRPVAMRAAHLPSQVSTTGTVPIGLVHGFRQPRPDAEACMLLRGQRVPVLRVCLENTILDLSGIRRPRAGEEVLALGGEGASSIQVSDLADWWNVSPMAAILSIGRQLNRVYSR